MTAKMIVKGVEGRPTRDPYGKLIPTDHAVSVPVTPTMIRAVKSGDLLEYEMKVETVENKLGITSKEDAPIVEEFKSGGPAIDKPSEKSEKRK